MSKAMQWLGVAYTGRFNNRHARSGHLFQGRFKRLIDHKWSRYPVYAYNRKSPEWLKTDLVLSQFGKDTPQRSYLKKVPRYSKEEASLFEALRYGLFFGTAGFADRLKSRFLKEIHPELLNFPNSAYCLKSMNSRN